MAAGRIGGRETGCKMAATQEEEPEGLIRRLVREGASAVAGAAGDVAALEPVEGEEEEVPRRGSAEDSLYAGEEGEDRRSTAGSDVVVVVRG